MTPPTYAPSVLFFGENEAEYGNAIEDNEKPTRDPKYYSAETAIKDLVLGGINATDLINDCGFKLSDLEAYFPVSPYDVEQVNMEVHYLSYKLMSNLKKSFYFNKSTK